jgi:hypothetical protein
MRTSLQVNRRDHKLISDDDSSEPDEIAASETESDIVELSEISSDDDTQATSLHSNFANQFEKLIKK